MSPAWKGAAERDEDRAKFSPSLKWFAASSCVTCSSVQRCHPISEHPSKSSSKFLLSPSIPKLSPSSTSFPPHMQRARDYSQGRDKPFCSWTSPCKPCLAQHQLQSRHPRALSCVLMVTAQVFSPAECLCAVFNTSRTGFWGRKAAASL